MASQIRLRLLFYSLFFTNALSYNTVSKTSLMYPYKCSEQIRTCESYLYHISEGLSIDQIASIYSVNSSDIKPIEHGLKQDYLISVPCTCKDVNGTQGYFYDTLYKVQEGDTFANISSMLFSGQAWKVANQVEQFIAGHWVSIHLVCGCTEVQFQVIVTYTVQENDTLLGIAEVLSAELTGIRSLNQQLSQNPSYIDVGWVFFVPKEKNGIRTPKQGKAHHVNLIIAVVLSVTFSLVCILTLLMLRRPRNRRNRVKFPEDANKCHSLSKFSLRSYFRKNDMEDAVFESEKPIAFRMEEIEKATSNFDRSLKIGEGGYGSVYLGSLKEREVAIKKMKASRSKEFFAELKVLCKIHHINVVELLGYASGDNHLYLVYEYIHNGSLSDHVHDPLLKGHVPLSWTARAQIALDAARGIEYIHDHTKAQYVHRDIKTSNILLDQGLRAKVADFGLVKLVERSNEEDFVATCLVGTPGYIAPESARELQMTSKTDVFAFGVVLAELITGQRALIRDNKEPSKMKALVTVILTIFENEEVKTALEANIDTNLKGSYPMADVYEMAEISRRCLSEDPLSRPEMREIVQALSQILASTKQWEASLGGSSQEFSGVLVGR